jgi:hypothetical protein
MELVSLLVCLFVAASQCQIQQTETHTTGNYAEKYAV